MKTIQSSLQNYLHLNTSFSDHIGLVNGKMGTVLFFSCLDDTYIKSEIIFNFSEEILSQISSRTPLSFGHGISGVGCLLEYLRRQEILDIDVNELVEDFEPHLLHSIKSGLSSDVTLEHGLSGYGLYLLSRYSSGVLSMENGTRVREGLATIINRVLDTTNVPVSLYTDTSMWTGISGIYMFLSQASAAGLMAVEHDEPIGNLIYGIIQNITTSQPGWHQVPLWHVLLNCRSILRKSGHADLVHSQLSIFLDWCSQTTDTIHFTDAAFYAALFHYTAVYQNMPECRLVSENLTEMTKRVLGANSLKVLFPYNHNERCINTGLFHGVSGTALAMHSLENNDFRWMEILGIENRYDTLNKIAS